MNSINERAAQYQRLAEEAGDRLEDQLARIRADYDRGQITVREAADERVKVLEEHLARVRNLRDEFLG